jgi:shikimate kinase
MRGRIVRLLGLQNPPLVELMYYLRVTLIGFEEKTLEQTKDDAEETVNTSSDFARSKLRCGIVALTGFMGSGKTSTGRALAELLRWEFVDLDEEIERREQVPIRQLFRECGEVEFRSIEHATLRACLARSLSPMVLALGGGAYILSDNVELLHTSEARTVFLETPIKEMLTRCGVEDVPDPENPRPLAADSTEFRRLYEQRLPSYRAAHLTIDTSGKTVEVVASEIAENLKPFIRR